MRRFDPTLRASAAAWLLLAASATLLSAPARADDDVLAPLRAAYVQAVTPGEQADHYRDLFATILQRVERSYATEVELAGLVAAAMQEIGRVPPGTGKPPEVFGKAIGAALRTLDPYSRYLDAGARSGASSGSFVGVGLELESGEGVLRVAASLPDSPAARAGLQPGDIIVQVDAKPLLGMSMADAVSLMRGQPGTAVAITIRRAGTPQEFTVSILRDTIRRTPFRWNMEGDVLVLRLAVFSSSVASTLQQAIAEATAAQAPSAVVLDMRGNPGGLLREAVQIADTFLSQGEIVSLRGRTPSNNRSWKSDPAELLAGVPMVVLIDRRSASASELVAAALQDNGRATVMGQRSFGKGTVQSTYTLGKDFGASLKLTTAHYHGPSGRSVQKVGVTPDIEVLTATGNPGGEPVAAKARVEQAHCASLVKISDPALACALAYLQAGNMEAFIAQTASP